jgi:hypothetical protein
MGGLHGIQDNHFYHEQYLKSVKCTTFKAYNVFALGLTRFRRGLQSSAGHTEGSGFLVNPSEQV